MYLTGSAKNCDYYKILQNMFVNDDVQLQHNKYGHHRGQVVHFARNDSEFPQGYYIWAIILRIS